MSAMRNRTERQADLQGVQLPQLHVDGVVPLDHVGLDEALLRLVVILQVQVAQPHVVANLPVCGRV